MLIGLYFINKNKTLKDYLLGGQNQRLLPVSLSMMTSHTSGLAMVGVPAEFYYHGINYSTMVIATFGMVPVVAFILLPTFYNLSSISINQYLEYRYTATVRRFVSLLFIIEFILYSGVTLYVPSIMLQSVSGISETISICIVGISCLVYVTFGGIKAVIWTDVFQAAIMTLAVICVIILGTLESGGFANIVEANWLGQRLDFAGYLQLDLTTRHTLFTIFLGQIFMSSFVFGTNQVQMQKSLTLPSLRLAQWSQFLSCLFMVLYFAALTYIGLLLYANYAGCDPFEGHLIKKRDSILLYYIINDKSMLIMPGLRGLFIAGIFAAAFSTLSSVNSAISALLLEDLIKPMILHITQIRLKKNTEIRLGKLLAFIVGFLFIVVAMNLSKVSGLLQIALTLFSTLGAPVLAAFIMGMLTRYTNTAGVLTGMIVGFAFGFYIQISQLSNAKPLVPTKYLTTANCPNIGYNNASSFFEPPKNFSSFDQAIGPPLERLDQISYLWICPIAFVITFVVATLASFATGGHKQPVDDSLLHKWLQRDTGYPKQLDLQISV